MIDEVSQPILVRIAVAKGDQCLEVSVPASWSWLSGVARSEGEVRSEKSQCPERYHCFEMNLGGGTVIHLEAMERSCTCGISVATGPSSGRQSFLSAGACSRRRLNRCTTGRLRLVRGEPWGERSWLGIGSRLVAGAIRNLSVVGVASA